MTKKALRLIPMLALAISVCVAGHASAEKATVVRAGNLVLRVNGGVGPKRLPRKRLAPITLRASGSLASVDGSHPPATKTVTVDFDKHGTINARGLAVCRHGKTTVEVAFPEQPPFSSTGPLELFNGGVHHGVTTMYIHAYVSVPTPTAIVTVVKIKHEHKGPYGTRAVARIPKIAGGSGSLTKFNFVIHRIFRRHGRRQSYLLARCANGRFRAHAVLQTDNGQRISGSILRRCKAR
jgi:hypothetical protein